jgi:CYTH domain-containing protein/predicted ATPase
MSITKIVITGGPCAGKSTAMTWIQDHFTKLGYTVLFIPETATELITGGVAPWTCNTNLDFQEFLAQLQITKEDVYERAAKNMGKDKVLIVCDRGLLDNKGYLQQKEFKELTKRLDTAEVELRDMYDAVFHLVTAANGAAEFYTLANNSARTETPEEAIAKDNALIAAWTGHPHFRVIDNSTDFNGKMLRLVHEIASFLGEPEPYEIERKFLIDYPDIAWLESLPNCEKVEILQTYLNSAPGDETRVRQRGKDGHYMYIKTTKKTVSAVKRIEIEQRLSKDEYLRLLMDADTNMHPLRKTRYCLTYNNQYFEIDVYPFSTNKAILEIELNDENTPIEFPPELNIIREVTDDRRFRNAELAKTLQFAEDAQPVELNEQEFIDKYCRNCGSQRCEGIGTEWFDGCHYKNQLKS